MSGETEQNTALSARITGTGRGDRVRSAVVGAALAVFVVAVAGCSGSDTNPSPTASSTAASASSVLSPSSSSSSRPTTSGSASSTPASTAGSTSYPADKEQVCQARDQLQTSVGALTNTSLLTGGTSGIKAAVDQVQNDLTAFATAAGQNYQPQVNALQTSLQQLQTTTGNLQDGNLAANLQTLGSGIASVATAATDLFTQLQADCGP
ncbi:MAG TPA: hypothetical protein VIJ23_06440 [Mycobacterium sp.]